MNIYSAIVLSVDNAPQLRSVNNKCGRCSRISRLFSSDRWLRPTISTFNSDKITILVNNSVRANTSRRFTFHISYIMYIVFEIDLIFGWTGDSTLLIWSWIICVISKYSWELIVGTWLPYNKLSLEVFCPKIRLLYLQNCTPSHVTC